MTDIQSGAGWSDAQCDLVGTAVTEAFDKASVAGKFLPCFGPLPDSAEYVRDESVSDEDGEVTVSDDRTLKLFTLAVMVRLSREQVTEEGLSSALLAFRRAAVLLAQVEDHLVFNGFKKPTESDGYAAKEQSGGYAAMAQRDRMVKSIVRSHPPDLAGLVPAGGTRRAPRGNAEGRGERLIGEVTKAIGALERLAHPGPFACILGSGLFDDAHTPSAGSMVLPADRIKPLLGGPLLRSGEMNDRDGILVGLSGTHIDLVVATSPRVQFLQITEGAKYLFRVYEKFTLRIKDPSAVTPLFS